MSLAAYNQNGDPQAAGARPELAGNGGLGQQEWHDLRHLRLRDLRSRGIPRSPNAVHPLNPQGPQRQVDGGANRSGHEGSARPEEAGTQKVLQTHERQRPQKVPQELGGQLRDRRLPRGQVGPVQQQAGLLLQAVCVRPPRADEGRGAVGEGEDWGGGALQGPSLLLQQLQSLRQPLQGGLRGGAQAGGPVAARHHRHRHPRPLLHRSALPGQDLHPRHAQSLHGHPPRLHHRRVHRIPLQTELPHQNSLIRLQSQFTASSPPRLLPVHRTLLPPAGGEVGLQLRQTPDTLLQSRQVAEASQNLGAHQAEHLQSVGQHEVDPGYSSAKVLLLAQKTAELLERPLRSFRKGLQGLFPGAVRIGSVDELGEVGDEVLVDSEDGSECDLFLCVSAEQVLPVGLVAGVDDDGRAFRDDLFSVYEVGQVGGWILLEVLGLVLLEPLVLVVLVVKHLLVLQPRVLQHQSDPLCQAADRPVAEHQLP